MQGLQIFSHAVRMVLNNLGPAMRISAALMLAQFALALLLGAQSIYTVAPEADATGTMGGGNFALVTIAQMLMGFWIVVAWHRYILREEAPGSFLPRFDLGAIWGYIIASILIILVIVPLVMLLSVVVALLLLPFMGSAGETFGFVVLGAAIYLPVVYISYRLSPMLASAALGARIPLKEAWYATGTSGSAFISLAVISVLAWIVVSLPAYVFGQSFIGAVWGFAVQWAVTLVGASIVTTIYGHYVEKRALDG